MAKIQLKQKNDISEVLGILEKIEKIRHVLGFQTMTLEETPKKTQDVKKSLL